MSKTKIVVIQLKEIIYTALFVALGILLILLLVFMFLGKRGDKETMATTSNKSYVAGVYTSSIKLSDNILNLELVVDADHINSVRLLNIDEAITTMFPLVESSLSKIEKQLVSGVDIEHVELSEESKYTQQLLVDAIKATLDKATVKESKVTTS